MDAITLSLGLRLKNTSNLREHWSARAKRAAHQRGLTRLAVAAANARTLLPCVVTMTRVSARQFDFDGLVCAMKACRDGVADGLGLPDDNNQQVAFAYAWRRGTPEHVEIAIERQT